MALYCFNHPEKIAKRNCYFCKKPLCPTCQLKLSHHIFCSTDCHAQWQEKEKAKSQKKSQEAISAQKLKKLEDSYSDLNIKLGELEKSVSLLKEKEKPKSSLGVIWISLFSFILLLVAGIIGIIIYSSKVQKKSSSLEEGSAKEELKQEKVVLKSFDPGYPMEVSQSLFLEPPQLELIPGTVELNADSITLYGRAVGAKKLTLLLNGREASSIELSFPEFSLQNVKLGSGQNLIQLLASDEQGNRAYSVAYLIEKEKESASVRFFPGLNYTRGPRTKPLLAITFDAGGDAGYAKEIIDILREKKVKTTIFLTGEFIEKNPQLVRQMVNDGNEIGNHTYNHPHLTTYPNNQRQWTLPGVNKEFIAQQLMSTAKIFKETTGAEMAPFWRAPYGEHNEEIRRWAEECGFYHIEWSREPGKIQYDMLDWLSDETNKHYRTSAQIRELLVNLDEGNFGDANGAIVLMHLSAPREDSFPFEVIAPGIDSLRAKGYELVRVSELLGKNLGKK